MNSNGIDRTATLLGEVFPGARIASHEYLTWLYEDSPDGPVVETNIDDDQGRAGHYALVPVELKADGDPRRGALSLNTAVHPRARGGGAFTHLAEQAYDEARQRGIDTIIGVANANSTPGFERRLGFTNHGPLPATVLVPVPGRQLLGSVPARKAADVLAASTALSADADRGLTRAWTVESLAWRLAAPDAEYTLHHGSGLLAVSTTDRRGPLTVAIVLAVFADHPLSRSESRAVTRAVCCHHRAPVALHVGHNPRAAFTGPPLPGFLRASPLNFISRSLTGAPVPAPGRFEFLDFDAY